MKILWHSNSPFAGTGYGVQTNVFTQRLAADGNKVIASCFYGVSGACLNFGKVKLLPSSREQYGNDILGAHVSFYRPDVTVILCDAWVFNPALIRDIGNVAFYAPVDHENVTKSVLERLVESETVLAMSKHGKKAMESSGLSPFYVPHGIDSKVFKPSDKKQARLSMKIPEDAFLVSMVLANKGTPSRKAFDQQIRAFSKLVSKHKDAILYLHTEVTGAYHGENLQALLHFHGVLPKNVAIVDQYLLANGMLDQGYMNDVYNASDIVMNATQAEGFGIPIVESQMTGTPVIVTDSTAMPELVSPDLGYIVGYSDKIWTPQNDYRFIPDAEQIEAALFKAYDKRKEDNREAIRASVMEYDADRVYQEHMLPALKKIVASRNSLKTNSDIITIQPGVKPDVTVVMPVYNAKSTVAKAIDSVLNQKKVSLELVVIDDASTDGTQTILDRYYSDSRVKVVRLVNGGGPVGALNESIKHIRGQYVIKLDADDWYEPGGLAILKGLLDDNPDVGFVYGACLYHGKINLMHTPRAFSADEFLSRNAAIGEPMYRATAHTEHSLKHRGFWSKGGRWFGPHDWDLMLQLVYDLGWKGLSTEALIHNYYHADNTASTETKSRNGDVMKAFKMQWDKVRARSI